MRRVHCPSRVLVAVASCARFHAAQAGRGRLRRPLRDWRHAGIEAIPPLRCCRTILLGMAPHYKCGDVDVLALPLPQARGGWEGAVALSVWRLALRLHRCLPSLRCCRQFCRAWLGTTGLADAGALALPLPQTRGGWEGRLRRLLRGWCYACIGAFRRCDVADSSAEHGWALQGWPTATYWPSLCRRQGEGWEGGATVRLAHPCTRLLRRCSGRLQVVEKKGGHWPPSG